MIQKNWWMGLLGGFALTLQAVASDYGAQPEVTAFVKKMVDEHGFTAAEIQSVLAQAEKKQSILDAISRPAEKTKPWHEYRNIFLGEERIQQGVDFWLENQQALERAEQTFAVPPQMIVAIIGVETRYGRYMGNYRVVDALATLGFDYPRRSTFFLGQLEELFLLAREQKQDILQLKGSYAGAMGYGQFIPSSYRHYAKDFSGDGLADIWTNKTDAIGSVANYFKAHGWLAGNPVLTQVELSKSIADDEFDKRSRPDVTMATWKTRGIVTQQKFPGDVKAMLLRYEQPKGWDYWLGFNNFYVITRYNRSHLYAMAVWQLSEEILSAKSKRDATKAE